MTADELLTQGVAAAQAGQLDRAQSLLARVVVADPQSEQAWLWLGLIQADPQRAAYCLSRALAINPANAEARQRLEELSATAAAAPPEPSARPAEPAPHPQEAPPAEPPLLPERETPHSEMTLPVESTEPSTGDPFVQLPLEGAPVEELLSELLPLAPASAPPFLPESGPPKSIPPALRAVVEEPPEPAAPMTAAALPSSREGLPVDKANALSAAPAPLEAGLIAAICFLIGLLIVGTPLLYLMATGRFESYIFAAAGGDRVPTPLAQAVAASAIPTATSSPAASATLAPTRTPTVPPTSVPTQGLPYEERLANNAGRLANASVAVQAGDCLEAIRLLDGVIREVPEHAGAYSQRALCYFNLSGSQRFLEETRDYLDRALADLNQAIALSPNQGDNYLLRMQVASMRGQLEEFRVVRDSWYEMALNDARAATLYGSSVARVEWYAPVLLLDLGRCEEAQAEFDTLTEAAGPETLPAIGLEAQQANTDLCLGDLDQALEHIEAAAGLQPDGNILFTRAIILYDLGRRPQALAQLNQILADQPDYNGERYYLRALIHYEQGNLDQALEDLQVGSGQTWFRGGLRAYVEARVALDAGNSTLGIAQMRYAEATMSRNYGPLLERLQEELAEMGATPLEPAGDGPQAR